MLPSRQPLVDPTAEGRSLSFNVDPILEHVMRIDSIQISNYKSYRESAELRLHAGINVITGQNNAGKTALLEALSLNIKNEPHRSIETISQAGMTPSGQPTLQVTLRVEEDERRRLLLLPGQSFWLPFPVKDTRFEGRHPLHYVNQNHEFMAKILQWLLERNTFRIQVTPGGSTTSADYPFERTSPQSAALVIDPNGEVKAKTTVGNALNDHGPGIHLAAHYRQTAYLFHAERFNLAVCPVGHNDVLTPNASNLAEVLSNLQGNSRRWDRYNEIVARILPNVKRVSVRNIPNNKVELFVWPHDPDSERFDLAVSLSACGTGIGQVLAILYVALNSDHPRTILIDEPQSFLHPGAVRKLIEVLRENPQHQYILTTHSPTVISASRPSTITLVKQTDGVSDFIKIDPTANEQLRRYLMEIGARLSDLFGADDVLWVEGPTEELCFPIILEKVANRPLRGMAIIAVNSTGDLEGRHAKTVFEVYERLTKSSGLLPPAVGFVFDREDRNQKQLDDIQLRSNGDVAFTKRRLYENYLLNPRAIAAVANAIPGFRSTPLTEQEVDAWIQNQLQEWQRGTEAIKKRKYFSGSFPESTDWREIIHGAKLLEYLFKDLSENIPYQKTEHSVQLTEWIAEKSPEDLRELADLLGDVIERGRKRNSQR